MTLSERLDQIEIGRKKGIREAVDTLKGELRMARTAMAATVDEQQREQLRDRIGVWVCAIEIVETCL